MSWKCACQCQGRTHFGRPLSTVWLEPEVERGQFLPSGKVWLIVQDVTEWEPTSVGGGVQLKCKRGRGFLEAQDYARENILVPPPQKKLPTQFHCENKYARQRKGRVPPTIHHVTM